LLITDPAAPPVRVTDDVDVIAEITSHGEYAKFSTRLRKSGFSEDSSDHLSMDRRRHEARCNANRRELLGVLKSLVQGSYRSCWHHNVESLELQVVTTPYFLATKIDAFKGRGHEDYQASKDLEDIITVIDGRASVLDEMRESTRKLGTPWQGEVASLLANRDFLDALPGHVPPDASSQARIPLIMEVSRSLREPTRRSGESPSVVRANRDRDPSSR
jgi:hypothetical protein